MKTLAALAFLLSFSAAHAQQHYVSRGYPSDSDVQAAPGDEVYRYGGQARNLTQDDEDDASLRARQHEIEAEGRRQDDGSHIDQPAARSYEAESDESADLRILQQMNREMETR